MKNNKGFGLIGVLVTIAILSIVALGTAEMLNNVLLVSQTSDIKSNATSLVASTMGVANNQVTCTAAVTAVPQVFGEAFQFNSLTTGSVLNDYKLTVSKLDFINPVLSGTGSDGVKAYYGTIVMTLSSNVHVYGSQTFAPRTVLAMYITVDPSGRITGCGPTMPQLAQAAPPPPPVDPNVDDSDPVISKGCSDIGGRCSHNICTLNSSK